jgi:hypothetical protein
MLGMATDAADMDVPDFARTGPLAGAAEAEVDEPVSHSVISEVRWLGHDAGSVSSSTWTSTSSPVTTLAARRR